MKNLHWYSKIKMWVLTWRKIKGKWLASQWTRKMNCEITRNVLLCDKSDSDVGPELLLDHSELEGDQHLSVTVLLSLTMLSIKIMSFWCSLSPRRATFIILGEKKTLVKTDYDILFLQWCGNTWKSIFPWKDDRNVVSGKDRAWKLPNSGNAIYSYQVPYMQVHIMAPGQRLRRLRHVGVQSESLTL